MEVFFGLLLVGSAILAISWAIYSLADSVNYVGDMLAAISQKLDARFGDDDDDDDEEEEEEECCPWCGAVVVVPGGIGCCSGPYGDEDDEDEDDDELEDEDDSTFIVYGFGRTRRPAA